MAANFLANGISYILQNPQTILNGIQTAHNIYQTGKKWYNQVFGPNVGPTKSVWEGAGNFVKRFANLGVPLSFKQPPRMVGIPPGALPGNAYKSAMKEGYQQVMDVGQPGGVGATAEGSVQKANGGGFGHLETAGLSSQALAAVAKNLAAP